MTKQTCVPEKRVEGRKRARGDVRFVLDGPGALTFEGSLLDTSKSGFRASHSHAALSTGQRVQFRHSLGAGRAVVMWNRILARHVESGFLIVKE
jgi:hypothetical protein